MKTTLLLAAVVGAAGLTTAASAEPKNQGPLAWMIGCWQSADHVSTEVWTAPIGGVMFGYAGTVENGSLTFYEHKHIDLRQARAVYWVSPSGDRPVVFVAPPPEPAPPPNVKRGKEPPPPATSTFENGDNAFPQRIQYRSSGRRALAATVSNLDGSRAVEFAWERCKD